MSAVEKPQATHKTIVGVCESFEVKNDWHNYSIRVDGNQYPTKLSTKKPELIALAAAVGNQRAEWGFLESQGGENPNRPGTYYVNRWLDSAVVVDGRQPAEQTEPVPDVEPPIAEQSAAPHPAESVSDDQSIWDKKDLRRHRQAAIAIAVSFHGIAPSPENVSPPSENHILATAERFVSFVYQTPEALSDGITAEDESIPF